MNPPSIPSHLNVFGYEENQSGALVKQRSNQVGFTGVKNDTVGPGDYDINKSKNVVGRTGGVVAWKKPTVARRNVEDDKTVGETPGPGQYDIVSQKSKNLTRGGFMAKGARTTTN